MTTTNEDIAQNWASINVLTEHRCKELLSSRQWGRFAAVLRGWPAILPVNYAFDGESIVIKSGASPLLDEAPMSPIAFEIDDADPEGQWGWSVLVQGAAFDITSADDPTSRRLRATPLKTFAPGRKEHWNRVVALHISGRSFGDIPGWSD